MRSVTLALTFATASAFARVPESPEITGKVVDAATGRPVPEALVVVKIGGDGGSMFGHGRYRQLHCTAVRADLLGRFRVPPWTWSKGREMDLDLDASIIAYHPEYTVYTPGASSFVIHPIRRTLFTGKLRKSSEVTVPMHRFVKGDVNAWDFKIALPIDGFRCDWDGDVKNEDLVWEALREEVEAFDAANPSRPLMWKLKLDTKRPKEPPPPPQHRSSAIRSPTDRGSSAPALSPGR